MKITHKQDVPHIVKPEGTIIDYYLFKEYEVHYNEQAPKTTQTWHHHEKIWEVLFILEGELTAKWREGNEEKEEVLKAGDLVETERSPHTFTNNTENIVKFLVFKQMPQGKDFSETFKTDKKLD